MTIRDFLVRGLLAGLLAGLATFAVAYTVGEPPLEQAISLETAGADHEAHGAGDDAAGHAHSHAEGHAHDHGESAAVGRGTQRTWGLLTGSLAVGLALGGLVALASAFAAGRMGRLRPAATTAVVALAGWVSVGLVPFWRYPANPPGVGSAGTIGDRTAAYFGFVGVSVLAAGLACWLAVRLFPARGAYVAALAGLGSYLVLVVTAGVLFPPAAASGDFPADVLWEFRRASLTTTTTLWAVLGLALTGLVAGHDGRRLRESARRELAASL